jgi:adenylosuccinate synthase
VLLRYTTRINGMSELAVTKLDVLSGLEALRLCVAYESGGRRLGDLEFGPTCLGECTPVYEDLPGWSEDLSAVRSWDDLPDAARAYLERISGLVGLPIRLVSVGAEREQLIER